MLGNVQTVNMTCLHGLITDEDTDRNRGQIRSLLNVTHLSFNNLKAKKIHQNVVRREQRPGFLITWFLIFHLIFYLFMVLHILASVLLKLFSHVG